MKILQCHIENFGTWSNQTFDFVEGCNVFCEENGWGKSTLAAFIRVMFYGFANERKKDDLSNERKKYAPWQGGVYGGQLIFSMDEVLYEISRTFGTREKEDTFEVRFVRTNQKCQQFTSRLGEELFQVDQQSFLRTVFLTQNDCETQMTDLIQNKISQLEMPREDRYEQANLRVADMLNKMSPTRKTGALFRLSEEIEDLSMQVRKKNQMEQSLQALYDARNVEREKGKVLEEKKAAWLNAQNERTQRSELRAKKQEYDACCRHSRQRVEHYQQVRDYFPASLPKREELEAAREKISVMEQEKQRAQIYQLTAEEEELLQEYEQKYWGTKLETLSNHQQEKTVLGIGIAAIVLGVMGSVTSIFWLPAGIVLWLLAVGSGLIWYKMRFADVTREESKQEALRLEIMKIELERYNQLQQKERLYENSRKKYTALRKEITSYIKSLGFAPGEDLQAQLQDLQLHLQSCTTAYQEYIRAKGEKEFFESNCEQMEAIWQWKDSDREDLDTEEEFRQLLESLDTCKEAIRNIEYQLEQQLEQRDALCVSEEKLRNCQKQYQEDKKRYEDLQKVQKYLQKAKESFALRYMQSLKDGFDKYYQMLTGQEALAYRMDVNANLTVLDHGMQRDGRLCSCGWRDLQGFCMRMAFVDAVYPNEKPCLILDDPFVNLDEEKTKKGLALLEQVGMEYQILYFTCHPSRR